jgi:hypothetical protein
MISSEESSENLKDTKEKSDVAERLPFAHQSQTSPTEIDRHALQEYITLLPEALVPELALLLAQRMKQRLRDSDTLRESNTHRSETEGSYDERVNTREPAVLANARVGRSVSISALRYIVTPDPGNRSICVKQSVGEPETIPYLPPGIYRENREGKLELESAFRRSMIDKKQEAKEAKEEEPTNPVPKEQGRLRKMMSKVFNKQSRE